MGVANRNNAKEKRDQLNDAGRTSRKTFTPRPATSRESAMKTYNASETPRKFRIQPFHSEGSSPREISHVLTSVPQRIINSAIETGARTGPHQGSGSRNRMSQSHNEWGQ